jgi:hypothetical protein
MLCNQPRRSKLDGPARLLAHSPRTRVAAKVGEAPLALHTSPDDTVAGRSGGAASADAEGIELTLRVCTAFSIAPVA